MLLNKLKFKKYSLAEISRNILWWIPDHDTLFTVLHLPWQLKCGYCAASAGFSWGSNLRLGHSLSLQWEEVCMWHYKHQAWSQSHGPVLWKASTSRLLTNIDILGALATPWEGFTGTSELGTVHDIPNATAKKRKQLPTDANIMRNAGLD